MNIRLAVFVPLAAVSILAGCSTAPSKQAAVEQCVFPGTQAAAPGWVCDEPVAGWEVTAQGVAEKTAAGIGFQKQMATTAARVALAQTFKVHVANMIKQFAETTGTADSETVDQVQSATTKQITDQTLVGSKVVKSVSDPQGRLWVLVGIDPKLAEDLTKDAVRSSYNNDRALWQKFQGNKSQDELASEIAAQKVNDNTATLPAASSPSN